MRLPDLAAPAHGDIHVWHVAADAPVEPAVLSAVLSTDEHARAAAFRQAADRNRFSAARAALRTLLGGCLGLPPAAVPLAAQTGAANWTTFSGNTLGHRFSELTQINRKTAGSLKPIWVYQIDKTDKFEASPIVIDGIMYISEPPSDVTALEGRSGRPLWKYRRVLPEDVRFCSILADGNRRQGLSIIDAKRLLVSNSVFKNTRGTRPSAGIDLEPDKPSQEITDIRIENSRFIDNAGAGILVAGKKARISRVEMTGNLFRGNRAIIVENAPGVAGAICDNRQTSTQAETAAGFNAYAEPIEIVALQNDCGESGFVLDRGVKKKKKQLN